MAAILSRPQCVKPLRWSCIGLLFRLIPSDFLTFQELNPVYLGNLYSLLLSFNMPKLTPTDPDSLGKVMGRLPQAGSVVKMASYKEHKKLFTTVWLQFLALKVRTLTPGGYGSNLKSVIFQTQFHDWYHEYLDQTCFQDLIKFFFCIHVYSFLGNGSIWNLHRAQQDDCHWLKWRFFPNDVSCDLPCVLAADGPVQEGAAGAEWCCDATHDKPSPAGWLPHQLLQYRCVEHCIYCGTCLKRPPLRVLLTVRWSFLRVK